MTTNDTQSGPRWYEGALSPQPICLMWLGIVIGVSVIEPPARFGATEITYAAALDVGREVFTALNRVEIGLAALALTLAWFCGAARLTWALLATVVVILGVQSAWLLPELSLRSAILVGGGTVEPSHAHATYGGLEVLKMVSLLIAGLAPTR